MKTIVMVIRGPHGLTTLVEEEGRYSFEGDPPDRSSLLMIARGVLEDATEEERAEIGAEGWH